MKSRVLANHEDGSYTWVSESVMTEIPGTNQSCRPTNVWRTYVDRYDYTRTIPEPDGRY